MPRMTLISATSESRIFSDWRFWAITASKRRFSVRTPSSRASATRSRAVCVKNSSTTPTITTADVALAAISHGFLIVAMRPRKSGRASLNPRLHVRRQVGAMRQALNHPLGVFRREPLFPLQVLAEAARTHREVARQHRYAVLEDVHVRHLVTDVHEARHALHRIGVVQLEGV